MCDTIFFTLHPKFPTSMTAVVPISDIDYDGLKFTMSHSLSKHDLNTKPQQYSSLS